MCWLSIQEDWWRLYRRDTLAGQTFGAKSEDEIVIETSSPQLSFETKTITRKPQLADLMMSRWLLPLILAFQALISWLLLQNTVFQDEALGKLLGRCWQQQHEHQCKKNGLANFLHGA